MQHSSLPELDLQASFGHPCCSLLTGKQADEAAGALQRGAIRVRSSARHDEDGLLAPLSHALLHLVLQGLRALSHLLKGFACLCAVFVPASAGTNAFPVI